MSTREILCLLAILVAYGIVGTMDYEDEIRREEMAAYTRALSQCLVWEER